MYPWLIGGTTAIGGNSTAPTNLKSFAGGFINMVFMVSSMLAGACATPEFLMYMNYFIGNEYGKDYWQHPDQQADLSLKKRSIDKVITDYFEQIVYSLNQPTGARNYQAVFWNVAYYDRYYFGMWPTTIATISSLFSASSTSPMAASPTGTVSLGCRSAS